MLLDHQAFALNSALAAKMMVPRHRTSGCCGTRSSCPVASPVYYYDWTHKPPISAGRYVEGQPVAGHSSEMVYLFNNLRAYDWDWTDYDRNLASVMSKYWLNFAFTGDPNGEGLPGWEKFKGAEGPALEIGQTITSVSPPRTDRYALLERYYNSDDGSE